MTEATAIPSTAIHSTIDEIENHCFGCGTDNAQGLQVTFVLGTAPDGSPTATGTATLTRTHQGAPGFVHGGIIATLMDEVMSKLNRPLGALAMTRHMEVDYLRPAPLGQPLTLTGRHLRRDARKLFHLAELTDAEGKVLATAKGLFIALDPEAVHASLATAASRQQPEETS